MKLTRLIRWPIATIAIALIVTACGGGPDDSVNAVSEAPTTQSVPAPGSDTDAEPEPAASSPPSDSETTGAEPAPTESAAPDGPAEESADPADNELPDVDVVDLSSGAEINLRTLAPADTPIVLWFWAPN